MLGDLEIILILINAFGDDGLFKMLLLMMDFRNFSPASNLAELSKPKVLALLEVSSHSHELMFVCFSRIYVMDNATGVSDISQFYAGKNIFVTGATGKPVITQHLSSSI